MAKKIHIWKRVKLSLRGKKIIVNQILFSKLWYIGQLYTIPKYIKMGIENRTYNFPWNRKKWSLPGTLLNSPFGGGGLGILDIDTQLSYIKIKWIQKLLNPTNAPSKDLMLYWLKLILNSDQGLALFRQKQILTGLLVTKIYKNRTMKVSLFNYSVLGYI